MRLLKEKKALTLLMLKECSNTKTVRTKLLVFNIMEKPRHTPGFLFDYYSDFKLCDGLNDEIQI
jgi:hypothetical protein